jgi:hypothetical protein
VTKKRGSLASFNDVSDEGTNKKDINININVNVDNDNIIDKLTAEKEIKKELVGIYFDADVEEALRKNFKKTRGLMSSIVNEATRRALQESGLL